MRGGYYIVSNDDEFRAYVRRYEHIIYKAARKARIGRKKWGNDEQLQAKLEAVELAIGYFYEHNFTGETRVEKHIGDKLSKMPIGQQVDKDNLNNKPQEIIYYDDDGNPLPF